MKSRLCHIAFITASLTVLTAAVSSHLRREWKAPARSSSVEMAGPGVDEAAEGTRFEAKHRIALEVLAGRTSLAAGAAAFRRLNYQSPSWMRLPEDYRGAASEDEAYCREMICWAHAEAPPERAEEIAKKLHLELDAMLRRGTLRLPEVGDAEPAGDGESPRSAVSRD